MRNIDHLMHAPAPAAYFHFEAGRTCPMPQLPSSTPQGQPQEQPQGQQQGQQQPPPPSNASACSLGVLNSGVMVLAPSPRLHRKARHANLERAALLLASSLTPSLTSFLNSFLTSSLTSFLTSSLTASSPRFHPRRGV